MIRQHLKRVRVLASIEWFTPAYQAGGIISSLANQAHHLSEQIDFWIVCSNRDLLTTLPTNPALDQWHDKDRHQVMYVTPPISWSDIIDEVQPDVIYINGIFNGPFCRSLILDKARQHLPTVLAAHGMLAPQALSIKSWVKKPWLVLNKALGKFDRITWHASNDIEATQIRNYFKHSVVKVAQNLPPKLPSILKTPQHGLRFLSVGRIHAIKNYSFAAKCLKVCAQRFNVDITYQLIGPIEDKSEQRLISQHETQRLSIEFLGEKSPHDLTEYYQNAQCLLVPSLSENFGLVVTESLGNGLPVIVSDNTPWIGYPASEVLKCLPLNEEQWIKMIKNHLSTAFRSSAISAGQDFFRRHLMSEEIIRQHIQLFS